MPHIHYYRTILNDHRKACESQGMYVEAEMAKNRIQDLKVQDYKRKYDE